MVSLRMSCNGCRVLRKGCSEDCSIRPCLQWIKTPQAQANATVFLAKFYGRTGLLNLINAGPNHLRPAIFQSLLHEACGRIANPIYGSTGLFCSGNWHLCEAAVEAVLSGSPIAVQMSAESDASKAANPPFKACNIRHVAMKEKAKPSGRIKRAGMKPTREPKAKSRGELHDGSPDVANAARVIFGWTRAGSPSQESGLSQHAEPGTWGGESEVQDSHFVEPQAKLKQPVVVNDIELELTL